VSDTPTDGGPASRQDVDHDLIAQAEDPYGDRYTDKQIYSQIDESQNRIPWWLVIMVGVVIVFAVLLNAPFLTGSGGHPLAHLLGRDGPLLDTGMVMALLYVGGGFAVIFWYTCRRGGS
jgi:hypothetical protein